MQYPSIFDVGFYVRETFTSNDSVADAVLAENDWELDLIGNASTTAYGSESGETYLRDTTAGVADGDGESYSLKDDAQTVGTGGGFIRVRMRYPNITGNQIAGNNARFGLTDVVTSGEPVVGLWIDLDAAVLSFDSASANGDLNATTEAAQGLAADLTSGTTLVLGTKTNLELRWHGSNTNADLGPKTVDGYAAGVHVARINNSLLDGAETVEAKIIHYQDTGGAATLELDVFGLEIASFLAK